MKPFFIPNIDQTEWNDFYLLILERYKKDYLISSKKIRGISYYFRSEYRSLFVGKELPGTEQVIYIILFDEIKKMYMVFAPDHEPKRRLKSSFRSLIVEKLSDSRFFILLSRYKFY